MSFIDEMIEDIVSKKKTIDNIAFLSFLKEELDREGIKLTIKRDNDLHLVSLNTSNIIGVEIDLSKHDKEKDAEIEELKTELKDEKIKNGFVNNTGNYLNDMVRKKDAEIEKYKKLFGIAEQERGKTAYKYQEEIDRLKSRVQELEESQETLPTEPIKMADWIIHHFEQGLYPGYERDDSGNIKCVELDGEKIPIQTGEYENYTEVREIADYLLAYCKHHSEE